MGEKYMNFIGELMTDVDYIAAGSPKEYLEVKMDRELPFRFYCSMKDNDWMEVTTDQRLKLIKEFKDQKSIYSRSDHRYHMIDFYLASLGGL